MSAYRTAGEVSGQWECAVCRAPYCGKEECRDVVYCRQARSKWNASAMRMWRSEMEDVAFLRSIGCEPRVPSLIPEPAHILSPWGLIDEAASLQRIREVVQ